MNDKYSTEGLIDLHVHAGPSLAPRSVDAVDMFNDARKAGMKAFCLKEHYMPTASLATVINTHLRTSEDDPLAYGGVVLNNAVGGFNLTAVDVAFCAGAAFVCLPTVSAKNHLERHKKRFSGAGDMATPEVPIYCFDENGDIREDLVEIFRYLGQHDDMLLMTGHISVEEINAVIPKAFEMGVKRILVNHPHYEIGADITDMKRWAEMGAYIELNACVFEGISNKTNVPLSVAAEMIKNISDELLVLDSDLGQRHNDPPVVALRRFIGFLQDRLGCSTEYLNKISKINPSKLLRKFEK